MPLLGGHPPKTAHEMGEQGTWAQCPAEWEQRALCLSSPTFLDSRPVSSSFEPCPGLI